MVVSEGSTARRTADGGKLFINDDRVFSFGDAVLRERWKDMGQLGP